MIREKNKEFQRKHPILSAFVLTLEIIVTFIILAIICTAIASGLDAANLEGSANLFGKVALGFAKLASNWGTWMGMAVLLLIYGLVVVAYKKKTGEHPEDVIERKAAEDEKANAKVRAKEKAEQEKYYESEEYDGL